MRLNVLGCFGHFSHSFIATENGVSMQGVAQKDSQYMERKRERGGGKEEWDAAASSETLDTAEPAINRTLRLLNYDADTESSFYFLCLHSFESCFSRKDPN